MAAWASPPAPSPDDADTLRILHISDIHNNVAAMNFVQELAADFHADAVIDTGDLTDYGLPVEATLSKGLARLPMPYLFVAGNHDSAGHRARRPRPPQRDILDGQRVDLDRPERPRPARPQFPPRGPGQRGHVRRRAHRLPPLSCWPT